MTIDVCERTTRVVANAPLNIVNQLNKFSTLAGMRCEDFFSCVISLETKFHEDLTPLRPAEKKYSPVSQRLALTAVLAGLQSLSRVTISGGGRVGLLTENVSGGRGFSRCSAVSADE